MATALEQLRRRREELATEPAEPVVAPAPSPAPALEQLKQRREEIAPAPFDVQEHLRRAIPAAEQRAREGLKVPSLEGFPDAVQSLAGEMPSFAAGFLSVPIDVVDQALEMIGREGILPADETGMDTINAAFEALGVPSQAVEGMAARMGRDTFVGLTTLAALFAAAPTMAAATGLTLPAFLNREVGKLMMTHPGMTALMDMFAAASFEPGQAAGGGVGEFLGQLFGAPETGKQIGEVVGGVGGTVTGARFGQAVSTAAGAPARAIRRLAEPRAAAPSPIRDPKVFSHEVTQFAQRAVEVETARLDALMERVLDSVPAVNRNTGQISARFVEALEDVHTKARTKEHGFWQGLLPAKADVEVPRSKSRLRRAIDLAGIGPQGMPSWIVRRLREISTKRVQDETGKTVTIDVPAHYEQVQRLQSDILGEAARMRKDGRFKQERDLRDIVDAMNADVADAAPAYGVDPLDIESAKAYSKYVNDLFRRGPLADVLASGSDRGPLVAPEKAITEILASQAARRKASGLEQVQRVAVEQQAPELLSEVTDWVRREFHDAAARARLDVPGEAGGEATEAAAVAARKAVAKHRETIEKLGESGAELTLAFENLGGLQRRVRDLGRSALMRASKQNPQQLAHEVFSAPDPKAHVEELMKTVRVDPLATIGLRNALIDQLFIRAGATTSVSPTVLGGTMTETTVSPVQLRTQLAHPRVEAALRAALGEPTFNRLREYVDLGVRLELGDERLHRQLLRGTARIAARVTGAQFGRTVAHLTGGGTVQTPGLAAGVAGRLVDRVLSTETAGELVSRAILDPAWAAVLKSRVPRLPEDVFVLAKKLRRAVAYNQALVSEGLRWGDEEPMPKPPLAR